MLNEKKIVKGEKIPTLITYLHVVSSECSVLVHNTTIGFHGRRTDSEAKYIFCSDPLL